MSEDSVGHVSPWVHVLFVGLIVALVAFIAVFFSAYPTQCQPGYKVVSTWLTQFCAEDQGHR